ncbi:MAG: alpha/beta hydrolase [Rhodospirillaceae bacterium]
MTAEPQFIDSGGKRLESRAIGDVAGAGPVLVFLHEALGSVSLWRDVPDRLAAMTRLPAFVYSRAGYGRSDPVDLPRPTHFHEIEAWDVLPEVLDAAGIERAVMIGHSDGGTIALMAAERDRRVRAVVTMAGHVMNEDVTRRGIADFTKTWATTDIRAKLERHHGANVDIAYRAWSETWLHDDFRDWNVEAGLPAVTCPVLIVQGENDAYGTMAQVEAIRAGVSGPSQVLIIPGCGHIPHFEAPDALFSRINQFIAELRL